MKREIKFRGKHYRTKEWMYKSLLDYDCDMFNSHVINETVCQYSGLQDCNGMEIYEGDILKTLEYSAILVVAYNHGGFGYEYCGEFYLFGGNSNFTFKPLNTDANFEIIGNIYDNPDLLIKKQPSSL